MTPQELPWDALSGRSLAVDAYNALYQFLATIRQRDGRPFTDPDGNPTSHMIGLFYRTTALLSDGVLPIWVFDGRPPELKAGTLRARFQAKERAQVAWEAALAAGDLETARKKAAQTSRLTRSMAEEAMKLLAALGVPTVQAPSEGEAQAAAMAAQGTVWATASEDYDSLLFGAPRLVRGLAARGGRAKNPEAQVILRDELLKSLGVSSDELILIGLIVGTDFNEGAPGYGPKKALKLVQQHMGWESTLKATGLDPEQMAPVAEIFQNPTVVPIPTPNFGPVDEQAVEVLLVDQHGFSRDRVRAAITRARRRPPPSALPADERGRQTLLDAFGGEKA